MPLTTNHHTIWRLIVEFVDGDMSFSTLPLEVRHLWLSSAQSILGVDLLPLHLLHRIIPGNDAGAALVVVLPHDIFEDCFIEQFCTDCADE